MARSWKLLPADPQAGGPGPLLVVGPSNGPLGRTACILPGNSARHAADITVERLLAPRFRTCYQWLARALSLTIAFKPCAASPSAAIGIRQL